MSVWEVDVELRVRKTLIIICGNEETARTIISLVLAADYGELSAFIKWSDGRRAHRPMPVETIIDNDPQIVAVREVSDA